MKNLIVLVFLCFVANVYSQKVGYNHDAHGNRTQRKLVVSSSSRFAPGADSSKTESPNEETMKLAMVYGVSVFPNPTQTNVNLVLNKIPEGSVAKAILFDNTGRILQTYNHLNSKDEIILTDFKPGIYYLEVNISEKDKLNYKIIKQ